MNIFLNDNDIDIPIGTSVEQLLIQLGSIEKQPTITINNEVIEAASYSKVIKEKDVVNVTRLGRKRYKTEELGFLDRFYRFRKQFKMNNIYKLKYYLCGLSFLSPSETVKCSDGFIQFYCPNSMIRSRARSLLTKEPETINWIKEIPKNDCLWDIGANVGVFSLYASLRGINVVAFEPLDLNYNILCKNIEINAASKNISGFNIALNSETTLDYFYIQHSQAGSSGNTFGQAYDVQRGKVFNDYLVQPTLGYTIDDFIETFDITIPNYIKMDVDGIEYKILSGARGLLKDTRLKSILVEIDLLNVGARKKIITLLGENDFKLIQIGDIVVNGNTMVFPMSGSCSNYRFIR